jgi:hypothetical protein
MRCGLMLLLLFGCALLSAQESFSDKKRRAKEFFYLNKYQKGQSILLAAKKNNRQEDKESKLLMALCSYNLNQLNDAEELLKGLLENEKNPFPETLLYLGKIHHDKQEFNKAIDYYKLYLKAISSNHPNRLAVLDEVRRCSVGQQQQFRPAKAIVENLGPQINTSYDEFGPLMSPNYTDRLYFSTTRQGNTGGARNQFGQPDDVFGRYYSDIFAGQLINGQWGGVQSMHYLLNSPQHEVLLDFSANGKALYYFKGTSFAQGQILIDTFRSGNRALTSDPFTAPLEAIAGLTAPHIFNDTLVIFPSLRPGGYGGLDLYKTALRKGRWTPPQNLGPEINSPYDETTPFLARDGRTLYFSSNQATASIGGFDVFRSFFIAAAGKWTSPDNLGIPINSAGDDTHFRLSRDGYTAFFCSARRDGMGERDIYAAYFYEYLQEMNGVSISSVPPSAVPVANRQPSPGGTVPNSVNVTRGETPLLKAIEYTSDAEWQQPALRIQMDPLIKIINENPGVQLVVSPSSRQEMAVSSRLFSAMKSAENIALYLRERGVPAQSLILRSRAPDPTQQSMKLVRFQLLVPDGLPLKPLYDPSSAPEKGLIYRLQIAQSSGIYQGTLLSQTGNPLMERGNVSGSYLYLVGQYATYAEALAARQRLGQSSQSGIAITPYADGHRINVEQASRMVFQYPDLQAFINGGG